MAISAYHVMLEKVGNYIFRGNHIFRDKYMYV